MTSKLKKMYIGIDGCGAGWFVVSLDDKDEFKIDIFSNIHALWNIYSSSSSILIDIPVGLPGGDITNRKCDLEARKILRPKKGSCVFPSPCRPAVTAKEGVWYLISIPHDPQFDLKEIQMEIVYRKWRSINYHA